MVINVWNQTQFLPLALHIKTKLVHTTPFLEITEAMERLHAKPFNQHRPAENTNRRVDLDWHASRGEKNRPLKPKVASLYNGFAVRMHGERNVYLVYNNERHLFPSEASMLCMGFYYEAILVFTRKHAYMPHRIMDNIPVGVDVPEEGVTIKITPTYVLRPRCRA